MSAFHPEKTIAFLGRKNLVCLLGTLHKVRIAPHHVVEDDFAKELHPHMRIRVASRELCRDFCQSLASQVLVTVEKLQSTG